PGPGGARLRGPHGRGVLLPRDRGVRRGRPRRAERPLGRRAGGPPVVDPGADAVGARRMRVLVTGGGGQLAADLSTESADAATLTPLRAELDVTDAGAVDALVAEVRPDLVP